ncbi:MAG: glycosyltransferase family 1 protein [Phycisphaerales bacterium]|nr:glycosyltransferase family 1 protein [Hyphomonadaceae bacterium]
MKRRGSIQAIADALGRKGYDTTFLSIRFSPFSLLKHDLRASLWDRANRIEAVGDLKCYLWRTPFHPFTSGSALTRAAMVPLHGLYGGWFNREIDQMIGEAQVIIIESGLGVALAPRVRSLNPGALLVYRGADTLDTIGAHPYLQALLERHSELFDHFCLLGRRMAPQFSWARERTFYVAQALDPADFEGAEASPYDGLGPVAVSVGSMLFDADFFSIAAPMFPHVHFVVIGCGQSMASIANVSLLPEMAFKKTIPYLKHATVGLAPYREAVSAAYLAESSLKLTQYAHLRRPAVCPHFAVGEFPHRFGYTPANPDEIRAALAQALEDKFITPSNVLSWSDVIDRMLEPARYPDTSIADAYFSGDFTGNSAAGFASAGGARAGASTAAQC